MLLVSRKQRDGRSWRNRSGKMQIARLSRRTKETKCDGLRQEIIQNKENVAATITDGPDRHAATGSKQELLPPAESLVLGGASLAREGRQPGRGIM